ncbi:MAG TPA: DUF2461 domain-containing protein [Fimbriimonadaceae bacterium]|nr:DUF2461 domain-containing protein [Fimbriimonadaceae bacterium]
MSWFTQDAFDFFSELEKSNTKEWFEANKKRYEASVKKPMLTFIEEMIGRMLELDPDVVTDPKKCMMRQHRDTRFSKDKSPYKICASMIISNGGKGDHATPGLYFSLLSDRVYVASGTYELETEQLRKVRQHIVDNEAEFVRLVNDPSFVSKFGEIIGEKNKMLPPEFREVGARVPLLFNKQFFYSAELKPAQVVSDQTLPDTVMDLMRAATPLNRFFARAL